MSIDSKLAHGLAGNSFREVMTYATGMMNLVQHLHFLPKTSVRTPKGARKLIANARRYISVAAIWLLEKETNREGPAIHWLFFTPADKDGNLRLCRARYAPISHDRIFSLEGLVFIKKHALARVHQRMDETHWSAIKNDLASITVMLQPMLEAVKLVSLKQIFIPVWNGIFVGAVGENGEVQINTFLSANNLSPRWQKAYALFEPFSAEVLAETKNPTLSVDCLLDDSLVVPQTAVAMLVEALGKPEFAWLQEDYLQGIDVEERYWDTRASSAM